MPNLQNVRRESRNIVGRFRGGQLAPVMATPFKPGEGGMLQQSIMMELDPVAGRLITPVTAQLMAVYVPVQAMDALQKPNDDTAGVTEILRQRLTGGAPLFNLEDETEISKRCGVMPRMIGGVPKVNEVVRLAHNAAVNFLRKRIYTYAAQVLAANNAMTPALLSTTALTMFGGVLNPDDHINGAVQLNLSSTRAPVPNIGMRTGAMDWAVAGQGIIKADGTQVAATGATGPEQWTDYQPASRQPMVKVTTTAPDGSTAAFPLADVYADLSGVSAGGISLTDFYNAERMDRLTREMRAMIDANPQDGEEIALRWAFGLSVDTGQHPFLLHSSEVIFGQDYQRATDKAGMDAETALSKMMQRIQFSVPVPKTELGGVVITFATVKPDETLHEQPHPILSDVWAADNLIAEEFQLDPVAVTARELQADVPQANEQTVCFYTGFNALKRMHVNYGLNRQLDPTTVENKTALWQYAIPASITPENIVYPPQIPQYPFLDQNAEICTYTLASQVVVQTPMYFGPSPVEEVGIIEDDNLFPQAAQGALTEQEGVSA